ncbi:MAG: hypothetical protein K2L07_13460 [Lachnospiraceae bacterium]|nr:hypothetical protein [Lachnospiraceae bacterium]
MYYIVGNMRQFESFTAAHGDIFPMQVLERLKKQIETLDGNYGSGRNLESDLGGYAVLFPVMNLEEQMERKAILEKYHAAEDEFDYCEEILQKDENLWVVELYILSSDYSVIFFYPEEKKGGIER